MTGPSCHPSKAAETSSNPCRVAPVTQRPPVGSGREQPVAPPVQAVGSSRPAGAPVPGTRRRRCRGGRHGPRAGRRRRRGPAGRRPCADGRLSTARRPWGRDLGCGFRADDGVPADEPVDGVHEAGHQRGAVLVASGLARLRHPGRAASDPAAARDVADEHGVERRGGLTGVGQVACDGPQCAAQPGHRDPQVGSGVEYRVAVLGGPARPRRTARSHPRELVELQQAADAVAGRRRVPAGLGLDLGHHPQRRELRALPSSEVGDQRQVTGGRQRGCGRRRHPTTVR